MNKVYNAGDRQCIMVTKIDETSDFTWPHSVEVGIRLKRSSLPISNI